MRRALLSFGAVVAIVAMAALMLPVFISADDVKEKILAEVENATGYHVRIDGPVSISMLPFLDLVADHVTVSESADGTARELAAADRLRFGLSFSGLLSGNVRLTEITLVRPVITLPQRSGAPAEVAGGATAGGLAGAAPAAAPASAALRSLSLDRLRIDGGIVVIPGTDGRPATRIEDVELTASLASFDGPLTFSAKARLGADSYAARGEIGAFGPLLDGHPATLRIEAEAPALLAKPVEIAGTAGYSGDSFALDSFTMRSATTAVDGQLRVDLSGETPALRLSIAGDNLDLDALLAKAEPKPLAPGLPAPSTAARPIDFSPLSRLAGEVDLSLTRFVVAGTTIQPLVGSMRFGGGRLEAIADIIGVVGASGAGTLTLDATRPDPYLSGKLRISGIDVAALNRIAGANAPVTGSAGADLVFATAGRSPAEWQSRFNASGTVTLADGTISGIGAAALTGNAGADRIEAITVTATIAEMTKPVSVAGSARWNGETFELSATADMRGLIVGSNAALIARAASQRVTAGFDGTVSRNGLGSGKVSLETPSLTGLMRWLGQQPAWQSGFETFAVSGILKLQDNAIAFEDASIRLDDTRGKGSGRIVFGAVPQVNAQLDLEKLDLNPYLGAAASPAGGHQAAAIDAGWSDAPIDFSALNAINAKLTVSAGELVYRDIKASRVNLAAVIEKGRLTADMPAFGLYGGTGSGTVTVDASSATPSQRLRFSLQGLEAYPFLRDAAGFERIEGSADVAIDVSATGASQRAIVSGLSGKASFQFSDGAIRGINVARMVRSLTSGTLSGWQQEQSEKTDFASLAASFEIDRGKAVNRDLNLIGPLVRMTGSGEVDLPAQTLAFRVDPKVVASLEGQGGRQDLQGLGVPVLISGPWSRPSIYPDIAGILQNPAAAYEQLRALGGGLFRLPDADKAAAPVAQIVDDIQKKTGVDVGAIVKDGRIDHRALQDQALKGLNQLLQGQRPQQQTLQPPPQAADPVETGSVNAKKKKPQHEQPALQDDQQQQVAEPPPGDPAADAAQKLFDSLFGKRN